MLTGRGSSLPAFQGPSLVQVEADAGEAGRGSKGAPWLPGWLAEKWSSWLPVVSHTRAPCPTPARPVQ